MHFDVIVIGGGVAGWTAARRAQQLGARVALLEKSQEGPGYSNSLLSGGRIHAAYLDPHRPADVLYEALSTKSAGFAREDVMRAWAGNAGRALDFLVSEGADLGPYSQLEFHRNAIQPQISHDPTATIPGNEWRGRGPHVLLSQMWQSFVDAGGAFRPGHRAVELLLEGKGVAGVVAETEGGRRHAITANSVVMADGGFQANRDLMARYVTTHYQLLGSESDTGDCLVMSTAAGAQTINLGSFYGNVVIRNLANEFGLMTVLPGLLMDDAIVVDGRGHRIGDEALGSDVQSIIDLPMSGRIAASATPGDCWMVFDEAIWEGAGRRAPSFGGLPANPGILKGDDMLLSRPSLSLLAQAAHLPVEALEGTVAAYNRFCAGGPPIHPPRSGHPHPIAQGPFHAVRVMTGVFYTLGGVLVNGKAEVLDADEHPIQGLYAAGGTMGGLGGGPDHAYAGGWTQASTFGLLAAESAAREES